MYSVGLAPQCRAFSSNIPDVTDLKIPVVCAVLRLIGHISQSHILSFLVIVVVTLHGLDVIGRQFLQEIIIILQLSNNIAT